MVGLGHSESSPDELNGTSNGEAVSDDNTSQTTQPLSISFGNITVQHTPSYDVAKIAGITMGAVSGAVIAIVALVCTLKVLKKRSKATGKEKALSSYGDWSKAVPHMRLSSKPDAIRYPQHAAPKTDTIRYPQHAAPTQIFQLTKEEKPVSPPDASPPSDYEVLRVEPVRVGTSQRLQTTKNRSHTTDGNTRKRQHDMSNPGSPAMSPHHPAMMRQNLFELSESKTDFSSATMQILSRQPSQEENEEGGGIETRKKYADKAPGAFYDSSISVQTAEYDMVSPGDALHPDSPFGDIVFTFQYLPAKGALHVEVIKAVGLRRPDVRDKAPSAYVKVLLYARDSRDSDSSALTHVVENNPNPVFKTLCVFAHYSCPWLMTARMKLKVLHCKSPILRRKNPRIGEAIVNFGSHGYNLLKKTTLVLPLQPPRH